MAPTSATSISFFEMSRAALSSLGLFNFLVGLAIAGVIKSLPFVLLVPVVVSAMCALGNGLSYYVYYVDSPAVNKGVACAFTDTFWTIQEVGLPFYGYAILIYTLRGGKRIIFIALYWVFIFVAIAVRSTVIVFNVLVMTNNISLRHHAAITSRLHIGYFVPIAITECLSAVFLLGQFRAGLRESASSPLGPSKLYPYLMRSTEIRVSMLALIGVSRAITFSFHTIGQEEGVADQLDIFVYMLQSFFPIILYVDILASRLVFSNECSTRGNNLGTAVIENCELPSPACNKSSAAEASGEQRKSAVTVQASILTTG
ncbi:hypothetical protein VFPPC_15046 [Pochonia chlamydosporia 170]|uniref:Uncharacterized protein n=1 Tax=Pochonia chlamydosporia 170 TaxID=1380566 RepID=A0A179G212_METCM|nr:hypothetical protein VFPPC_15046 [Pochonia chlamydosporia 170]OAQ71925.1 hypothetical protein VFPPC_15046 [Pochonia chlamydosporia 170]